MSDGSERTSHSTWSKGTVAMVTFDDGGSQQAQVDADEWWTLASDANHGGWKPTAVRPLLVLDPDDVEQMEALAKAHDDYWATGEAHGNAQQMSCAVRSLLPQPIIKPDEPTGFGARVRLREGQLAMCVGGGLWITEWQEGQAVTLRHWAELHVVEVLFAGGPIAQRADLLI